MKKGGIEIREERREVAVTRDNSGHDRYIGLGKFGLLGLS